MTDRKFPIGPFVPQESYSKEELGKLIQDIALAPLEYKKRLEGISESDLAKTYRTGSFTVRQLVHHVADIHLLHYFRMKQALTNTDYKEVTLINMDGWAATPDGIDAPIEDSLDILESMGKRYVYLINSLMDEQFEIAYFHPLRKIWLTQKHAIAMSAWHVKHHLAHVDLALSDIA